MTTGHHDPLTDGRRRVLLAIAIATGLLCLVAAASAYARLGAGVATIGLVLAAGAALGFGCLVHLGVADWLTDDEQLLWKTSGERE